MSDSTVSRDVSDDLPRASSSKMIECRVVWSHRGSGTAVSPIGSSSSA